MIIIGGGQQARKRGSPATALRGLRVILGERGMMPATGATGRNHGLLHGGARYAVTRRGIPRAVRSENQILKRIAPPLRPNRRMVCLLRLPESDLFAFQAAFITLRSGEAFALKPSIRSEARIIDLPLTLRSSVR